MSIFPKDGNFSQGCQLFHRKSSFNLQELNATTTNKQTDLAKRRLLDLWCRLTPQVKTCPGGSRIQSRGELSSNTSLNSLCGIMHFSRKLDLRLPKERECTSCPCLHQVPLLCWARDPDDDPAFDNLHIHSCGRKQSILPAYASGDDCWRNRCSSTSFSSPRSCKHSLSQQSP